MSGVLDFLFEGKPPASVTTYGTKTENMPQWLSDYTQGMIARANAVAAEPYQPYSGARLASQGRDASSAYDMTRGIVDQTNGRMNGAIGMQTGMQAAQPYMNTASQQFPDQVSKYMNPYTENVINRASTLAGRTLNEQFLPSLEGVFGRAGSSSRSSAYKRTADRGVRDLTEGLQGQAQAALAGAYDNAGTMFNQDANRAGNLAQVAGSLAGSDSTRSVENARAAQESGLTGAGALEAIGNREQQERQREMDLAYQDFTQQRDAPRDTINWMNSVVRGIPYTSQTSSSQTTNGGDVGPSPLSQMTGMATGIGGIISALNRKRRGGRVTRPKHKAGVLSYGTRRV